MLQVWNGEKHWNPKTSGRLWTTRMWEGRYTCHHFNRLKLLSSLAFCFVLHKALCYMSVCQFINLTSPPSTYSFLDRSQPSFTKAIWKEATVELQPRVNQSLLNKTFPLPRCNFYYLLLLLFFQELEAGTGGHNFLWIIPETWKNRHISFICRSYICLRRTYSCFVAVALVVLDCEQSYFSLA